MDECEIVGDADAGPGEIGDLAAERYNEHGDEFRTVFQRFGFDLDEAEALEQKLDNGKILLLIS